MKEGAGGLSGLETAAGWSVRRLGSNGDGVGLGIGMPALQKAHARTLPIKQTQHARQVTLEARMGGREV